ncbi:hypothetical protein C7U60_13655 [Mesorhizobium plurifarium]|uniref:hypothetical protein n=1 Tax=Sinorhizobium arboris TaxID=76745 RepID=UPI00067F0420|nr:hypothetical protein [Sinorhizobium arboris]PST22267.1 hypothetical protein C7U60_13655 [Mesorhizobium plurifarium]
MAVDYAKLLAKIDRPPSGPNWVRFVHDDVVRTTKSIVSFVKGAPPFTYAPGYAAIKDRLQLGIEMGTALKAVQRVGPPAGRKQNEELVMSFFEHDQARGYAARNAVEFEREVFRISRDIAVPVAPLSIIRERGQFLPLFVCGWSEVKLNEHQRRLLVTICEDAFLSLTDYQKSPAEFLFFPKTDDGAETKRRAEVWHRGDYRLLTDRELSEAVEVFLEAREAARAIILKEMAEAARRKPVEDEVPSVHAERDLLSFDDD